MAQRQDFSPFGGAKFVRGPWPHRRRSTIGLDGLTPGPALIGADINTQLRAGRLQPCSLATGFLDQLNGLLAIREADHSSSSLPQIASAFFRNTNSAAVSASALFLRCSSCSNSWTRRASVPALVVARGITWLPFAYSQRCRQPWSCSGESPRLRQYSPRCASFRAVVSTTMANFSALLQRSLGLVDPIKGSPRARQACRRQP